MKKRYLFIYLFLLLILTGCNAKYSLEIKDGMIKETFSVIEKSDSDVINIKDEFGNSFYDYSLKYGEEEDIDTSFDALYSPSKCQSDCSFYDKQIINDSGIIGFELSHKFTFEEYSYSSIAKEIIPGFSTIYDGRYMKISGGPNWTYFDSYEHLENIDLTIDTNYRVVSTNLKKVREGKYEWNITKGDGNLYITLDTNTIVNTNINEKDNNNNQMILYLIILLVLLVIALFVCSINNRKKYR